MRPWIGAAAVLALGVGISACGDQPTETGSSARADDPGQVHIHGLGLNPADGSLFIATHTGLFRTPSDTDRSARVGDRYQDTMGFAVVGPDHFLGSGHSPRRS